jgi:hypothetical protein
MNASSYLASDPFVTPLDSTNVFNVIRYKADVYVRVPSRLFHRTCDWIGGHSPVNSVKFESRYDEHFFGPGLLRIVLHIFPAKISIEVRHLSTLGPDEHKQ